ncbi:MAG: 2-hydroxyacyl-CoA dehydratase [Candidatus Tectomicrobia bacterium]|uniref:2-hydroxyacyl-CoA dehydratase n=1 Tax=Tectimicrobiota bacterium TaxID=2528274 RepID=A0A932FX98_UNCTE|nr:2-hydroxyacyl-CoA dehydratase [Candidatus Tectomicrobia bacterium]
MTIAKLPEIQDLIDHIHRLIEEKKETHQLRATLPYLQLMAQYFEQAARAREEGKHLVAHTTQLPVEIFYAMDVVPFFIETYCLFLNFFEDCQEFLAIAAEHGIPSEICSVHRVTDAMAMTGTFLHSDSFVFSNLVCDNTPKGGESMAQLLKAPAYCLDRPYRLTEPHMAYWKEELEGLVSFLEEQTGRKMDYDRLQETVRLSYRATELCQEINELRQVVPCPLPAEGFFEQAAVYWLLAGRPEAVHFFEQLRDELKERVSQGIGAVPKERFRIIYPFVAPFWDMELMEVMEQKYGAVTTMDLLGHWRGRGEWFTDPSDPLGNLARKSSVFPGSFHLHGPMEEYVEDIVRVGREYRADGAIYFAHIGCRQGCAAIRAIRDELQSQLNIPMAVIDCDLIDKAFTSRKEVMDKLDGFFEMLEEQKG